MQHGAQHMLVVVELALAAVPPQAQADLVGAAAPATDVQPLRAYAGRQPGCDCRLVRFGAELGAGAELKRL